MGSGTTGIACTFNRTIVELKYEYSVENGLTYISFNRTIVELKLIYLVYEMGDKFTFNRTIVELKSAPS